MGMSDSKPAMTASQRARRIERRAPGKFVVLLWTSEDDDALVRVVRVGRIVPLTLGTSDFSRRPLNAVRWAARHYNVDIVYVVSSRHEADHDAHCRKYTRRASKPADPRPEGTVCDPDFRTG
jgi:hypothetical protein